MVFRSLTLFVRARNHDRVWKRRRILSLSAYLYGRRRNCYKIAVRGMTGVLKRDTFYRKQMRTEYRELWDTRIHAACEELGTTYEDLYKVLDEAGIGINRRVLNEIAIWEPRTFRALASLTRSVVAEEQISDPFGPLPPPGVVTRGML